MFLPQLISTTLEKSIIISPIITVIKPYLIMLPTNGTYVGNKRHVDYRQTDCLLPTYKIHYNKLKHLAIRDSIHTPYS